MGRLARTLFSFCLGLLFDSDCFLGLFVWFRFSSVVSSSLKSCPPVSLGLCGGPRGNAKNERNSSGHFWFSHSAAVPLEDWSGKTGSWGLRTFSRGKTVSVQNGFWKVRVFSGFLKTVQKAKG